MAGMDITLYVFPGGEGIPSVSPPCVRVQLALARGGVEYRTVYVKSWAEAAKFSATGRLPAIEIDGDRFCDSVEILDELERRFPEIALTPTDPHARMRDRLWEHYVNDHVYWLGYYMRWTDEEGHRRFSKAMLARAPFLMRLLAPRMMRRFTRNRSKQIGILGKSREEILRAFERSLEIFEEGLGDGPFFEGRDTPGRGDLASASTACQVAFRDTMPESRQLLEGHPAMVEHTRRVFEACSLDLPRWLARP